MDESWEQWASRLTPGEKLLWSGKPDPAVWFTRSDLFLVPLSLVWCGFAILWEFQAVAGSVSFSLVGIPFVVIGIYFVFGRFFFKQWQKGRTSYALTENRALVLVGGRSLTESPVHGVPIESSESRDGSHLSVTFGNAIVSPFGRSSGMYANTGMDFFNRMNGTQVAFFDVADLAELSTALDRVRAAAGSGAA